MAQLTNTIVNGDLRVTGNIYGTLSGNAATATKATQDGNGSTISSTYLKLSGGTMSGVLTLKSGQYDDSITSSTSHALNLQNSNIIGINAIYTADSADNAAEGIHFFRDSTHFDSLWMNGGYMYFVPNRALGSQTTAANSRKVGILPASVTDNQVVLTDGTNGYLKTTSMSNLSVDTANKLNYRNSNEINFSNVSSSTDSRTRHWFNYNNGDTNTADSSYQLKNYFFGNRNHSVNNVNLHAGGYCLHATTDNNVIHGRITYNTSTSTIDFSFS